MSASNLTKRLTPRDIRLKKGGTPIVSLTAYSAPMARFLDEHCDLLLVGDSLGMVLYGLESTTSVTIEMMIAHGSAVMRGTQKSCVVVDMPFGSYQESKELAFRNAVRIMQETGCDAVKLEGGVEMAETISFLVKRGVPVLGHIGLMPQQVHTSGGYRSVGRSDTEIETLKSDARAVSEAGAFSVVLEGTVETVAAEITALIPIPTIGIGASVTCDGQVLVTEDMLGLFGDFRPRFVKRYENLGTTIAQVASKYASEVRNRTFPELHHTYSVTSERQAGDTERFSLSVVE